MPLAIVTRILGDGVVTITKYTKLLMGSCKEILLQMQPNLVSHLKLVWHLVLILALLVLIIGFLQNIMDLLEDVLNPINKLGGFFGLRLNMGRFCLTSRKGQCDINGT
jgi:hypothetical protein